MRFRWRELLSLLATAAILALELPLSTGADSRPLATLGVDTQIAIAAWGVPCGGDYSVLYDPEVFGLASWMQNDDGSRSHCIARINPGLPEPDRCSVTVHEVGHLAGQVHSTDPKSVMYPVATPENIYPPCWAAYPRSKLERHHPRRRYHHHQ